jgi:hypothetical protein
MLAFTLLLFSSLNQDREEIEHKIAELRATAEELRAQLSQDESNEEVRNRLRHVEMQMQELLSGMETPRREGETPERILAALKVIAPELAAQLEPFLKENPEENRHLARGLLEQARNLVRLRRERPDSFDQQVKMFKLEVKALELARQARGAKDAHSTEGARSELQKVLEDLFDQRESQQRREIEDMERRLREMKERLESRKANRASIIDRRIAQLLGESDDLEW